ncbi:hypothetical protein BO94DRAFT_572499 [Aspergillus sclerotioniger CBS 115572]|uniref:Uncharacterized protein n=1 Tax=Aspergillus sclerotioniger CBS 115572 TaxID=1450535 RepID=A0A317X5S0_9EURO|nr:hypothetical protein BO94DRAFT_572499 [Aspergillus sclerotioniger CBS 115572]PWY93954.1 hypothetical protein BO94DRAFT_572499 [Aspergillus sclerotioniger CBS 115572]
MQLLVNTSNPDVLSIPDPRSYSPRPAPPPSRRGQLHISNSHLLPPTTDKHLKTCPNLKPTPSPPPTHFHQLQTTTPHHTNKKSTKMIFKTLTHLLNTLDELTEIGHSLLSSTLIAQNSHGDHPLYTSYALSLASTLPPPPPPSPSTKPSKPPPNCAK